jgi:hypothetical protein
MPGNTSASPTDWSRRSAAKPASRSAASTAPAAGPDTAFLVGEEVDVARGPADNPVGQQRVAAAEGEPVSGRRAERDARHLGVQRRDWHQAEAAAAARSTG